MSRPNNAQITLETRDKRLEEVLPLATQGDARRPSKAPGKAGYAEAQRSVMAALGVYSKSHSVPPLDRGLRSIVVQQIGNLLKGGWPVEEIKAQALSIFSQYNLAQGHKLMTQLQRTMELADEERQFEDHKKRKNNDYVSRDVAALLPSKAMPESRRNHPNNHAFEWDSSDSCRRCGGPPGVHVKRVAAVS